MRQVVSSPTPVFRQETFNRGVARLALGPAGTPAAAVAAVATTGGLFAVDTAAQPNARLSFVADGCAACFLPSTPPRNSCSCGSG